MFVVTVGAVGTVGAWKVAMVVHTVQRSGILMVVQVGSC